jgi:tagatose 1,6-diphosphate aldolase
MNKRSVTVGKYRGLQRASTAQGHFNILAIDHQDALRRVMKPDAPQSVTTEEVIAFKMQVVKAFAAEVSGLLLDPIYGLAQAICAGSVGQTAIIAEVEKADYQLEPMPLVGELLPDWTVAKVKRAGADGVKLFYYYNTDGDAAHIAAQDELLRSVSEACSEQDIALYAEPILFPIGEDDATYQREYTRRQFEAARRTARHADILKLEFPVPPSALDDERLCRDACARLTDSLDVPWVLLSAGVSFEAFCRQVEIACHAGASGYIAGRAVWGEAALMNDADERQAWLETTGRERLRELGSITTAGRPWTVLIGCEPVTTEWYRTYGVGAQ